GGNPSVARHREPSSGRAPVLVQEIFRILRVINKEERMSMLLVEQNARLALDLVSQVFLLETGRVVASGPPQQIAADETVRRAYLGRDQDGVFQPLLARLGRRRPDAC